MNPAVQDSLGQLLIAAVGVATTVLGYVGVLVAQWFQSKRKELKQTVGESNFWLLEQAALTVVKGIEQLAKSAPGREKLDMALERLAEIARMHKVDISSDLLRTLVEAAVKKMNEEKKPVLLEGTPIRWPDVLTPPQPPSE